MNPEKDLREARAGWTPPEDKLHGDLKREVSAIALTMGALFDRCLSTMALQEETNRKLSDALRNAQCEIEMLRERLKVWGAPTI